MNKQFPKKQSRLSPAQTFRRCSTLILSLILTTFLAGNVSAAESTADTKAPGAECTHGSKHKNLSPEQLKARGDTHFKKVDTDNDGSITPAELSQAKLPHSGHHRSRHAKHRLFAKSHGKAGKKELGSSDKHAAFHAKLYEAMDTNADGTLSKAEFSDIQKVRKSLIKQHIFKRMDANNDGLLTRDEFPPHRRHHSSGKQAD